MSPLPTRFFSRFTLPHRRLNALLAAIALLALLLTTAPLAVNAAVSPAAPEQALAPECGDVPANTLRIINFNDQPTTVSRSGGGASFTMQPGETRDVAAVAGQRWMGAHLSAGSAARILYPVPTDGRGCMVMGTPPAPVALPDDPKCQNIPEGTYGRPTLRIINYHDTLQRVSVLGTGGNNSVTLQPGEVRDFPAVSGEKWAYRVGENLLQGHDVARGKVDCWVLGEPNAATPTPAPLPDDPACKNITTPAAGNNIIVIVNYLPYPMQIQQPNGEKWPLDTNELVELEAPDLSGEWWAHPGIVGAVRWRYVMPTSGPGCFVLGSPADQPNAAGENTPVATSAASGPNAASTIAFPPTPTATFAAPTPTVEPQVLSLRSNNYPTRYVRHRSYRGYIEEGASDGDKQDASFRMVPGLGDPNGVSFEATNLPGFYLTVEGNEVVLRQRTGDAAFDKGATFIRQPGLADPSGISLESLAVPGAYVRHSGFQLFVMPPDDTDIFRQDATFGIVPPLWSGDQPASQPATNEQATAAPADATVVSAEATPAPAEATAAPAEATAAPEQPTSEPTVPPTLLPTMTPTTAPTPTPSPTPTPDEHQACTQDDFIKAMKEGDKPNGTVTLDGSCTYKLTSASDTWEGGSGAFLYNATVIEGNGAIIERDPSAPQFRILGAQADSITVRNLTLRNGASSTLGGSIYFVNKGVLENVTIEASSAADDGGAVAAQQGLVLRNVSITGSKSSANGGAIFNWAGDLVLDNVRLINNQATSDGGAIYKPGGRLQITDTLFAQNRGGNGKAAAIFIGGQGAPNSAIYNSTIVDNNRNPGTAIVSWSSLTVNNTIIANHEVGVAVGGKTSVLNENYNLFAGNGINTKTFNNATISAGANSVVAPSVVFVDAAALDYRLTRGSPAADRGSSAPLNTHSALAIDLDNQARPYSGTQVDIGAFELQDQAGAAISISKEGPHWFTSTVPVTFTLTVANNGVASANNLLVTDQLPVGATLVNGSISGGGVHANGAIQWQIASLAPNASAQFNYAVMGTQTLVSSNYGVTSASETYINAQGAVLTTTLNSNLLTRFGFFPNPDGYSFENYSDSPQTDLTATEMEAIFGASAVCKAKSNPCVLTATAEAWRQKWIKFLEGGHCAGLTAGSLNIYVNPNVNASDFMSTAEVTFDLDKASARNNIALFAAAQSDPPANWAALEKAGMKGTPANDPVSVLDLLIKNLNDLNATERYRISISFRAGGGGHAMVPYAVERIQGEDYYIYVYDNNYPNDFTRAIKINRNSGVWSYVGTTNPSVPTMTYNGDKTTTNLALRSITWHLTMPKTCDTVSGCPPPTPTATATPTATPSSTAADSSVFDGAVVEVMLDGEGNPLVTRSDGAQIGFDGATGEWINEIDGAVAVELDLGLGFNIPPAIRIPYEPGMTYDIQVAPRETTYGNTEAPANLNISGPGFAVAVTDLVIHSPQPAMAEAAVEGEENTEEAASVPDITAFKVDPDLKQILVQPTGEEGETPSISLAVTQPDGSDFNVTVSNIALASGDAVAVGFDAETQAVQIASTLPGEQAWQVDVTRTNMDGTQDVFTSDSVSDGGEAGVTMLVGDEWSGEGEPATEPLIDDSASTGEDDPAAEEAPADETPAARPVAFCDASDVPASVNSDVMLRFVNESDDFATLYWDDGAGTLYEYNQIAPGEWYDQETFAGHMWVAADPSDTILLEYTAGEDAQQCVRIQQP